MFQTNLVQGAGYATKISLLRSLVASQQKHSNTNVRCNGFLLYVVSIPFFTVTCVDLVLTLKKNCEILKFVLLIIFYREKQQLPYLLD